MTDEEKVVVSDNEIGNPNHKPAGSPEGGQFTSADGIGGGTTTEKDQDVGVFNFEKEKKKNSPFNISLDNVMNFISQKKEEKNQEARAFLDSTFSELEPKMQDFYKGLSKEECLELLVNSKEGYNSTFLKFATDKQLLSLLVAEGVLNKNIHIEQQLELALQKREEKKEYEQSLIQNVPLDLENLGYKTSISNVWYGEVYLSSYQDKATVDETGTSPIERKKAYYQDILNDDSQEFYKKADATAKLKNLEEWEKAGQEYLKRVNDIKNNYSYILEEIEQDISKLSQQKQHLEEKNPIFDLCREYIGKFQDKDAAYSKARKDNATWINQKWLKLHPEYGNNVVNAATKYFGKKFEKIWNNLSYNERNQLIDYTGGGYSKYNKPLRGLEHSGWYGWQFAEKVINLTNALNKCVWDEDIWVQRGIEDTGLFKLPGSNELKTLSEISYNSQLQSLVGTTFTDFGFYSSGAGKGTGFSGDIIFNTYCPKGTKMAYMNTHGTYSHSNENEMVLQRGYTYRITKAEKKNGIFYIDCEVILGSDEKNNITDKEKLEMIGKKYLN